ncbi:MAG: hypothetical protein QOI23_1079, partial [Chloroflexota bacterium]|nr:hypothetical protein [Chloroflexota bacterium]
MDESLRTELRDTPNLIPAQAELYLAEGQRLAHTGSWAFKAGGFEYWSAELFRIHGLEPSGRAPTIAEYMALVHPEDRDGVAREIQKMLANNGAFDFTKRIVRPYGEIRHVRCVGMPAPRGGIFRGFVGTGMDVTEQEQLTEALRKSEENFRLVVDGIAALVVVTNPESKVEFINQQVLEYFDKTREEVKDRWPSEAVHPDDRDAACAGWMEAVQGGHPFEIDHRLRRHDGVYRWFRMRGRPSRDSQGRIIRWYSMLTDIDERKKA